MSGVRASNADGTLLPPSIHSVRCTVKPVVVFSVLDHFLRRSEQQERVIGTLLGVNNDGHINITNCFPVPHTEAETVGIDKDFHRTMFELYRKATPGEIIVGWYTSGTAVNDHSKLIHDFYGREIQRPPIHLCVSTDMTGGEGVRVTALMSSSVALKDKVFGSQFSRIPCSVVYDAQDSLVITAYSAGKGPGAKKNQLKRRGVKEMAGELKEMLADIKKYVDGVVEGSIPADNEVGRKLMQAISEMPKVAPEDLDKMVNSHLEDLLVVAHLAKLTRAQLKVAEELFAFV